MPGLTSVPGLLDAVARALLKVDSTASVEELAGAVSALSGDEERPAPLATAIFAAYKYLNRETSPNPEEVTAEWIRSAWVVLYANAVHESETVRATAKMLRPEIRRVAVAVEQVEWTRNIDYGGPLARLDLILAKYVLGIDSDEMIDDLGEAWATAAGAVHPALHPENPGALSRFRLVNAAFLLLTGYGSEDAHLQFQYHLGPILSGVPVKDIALVAPVEPQRSPPFCCRLPIADTGIDRYQRMSIQHVPAWNPFAEISTDYVGVRIDVNGVHLSISPDEEHRWIREESSPGGVRVPVSSVEVVDKANWSSRPERDWSGEHAVLPNAMAELVVGTLEEGKRAFISKADGDRLKRDGFVDMCVPAVSHADGYRRVPVLRKGKELIVYTGLIRSRVPICDSALPLTTPPGPSEPDYISMA